MAGCVCVCGGGLCLCVCLTYLEKGEMTYGHTAAQLKCQVCQTDSSPPGDAALLSPPPLIPKNTPASPHPRTLALRHIPVQKETTQSSTQSFHVDTRWVGSVSCVMCVWTCVCRRESGDFLHFNTALGPLITLTGGTDNNISVNVQCACKWWEQPEKRLINVTFKFTMQVFLN